MKQITTLSLLIILLSCKTSDDRILYNQLLNYRDDLKLSVRANRDYIAEQVYNKPFYKKRFDSLNKINTELQRRFEQLQYEKREPVLALRDEFNKKYDLNLKFDSAEFYLETSDSLFDRLTETDILRLRKKFQERYMFEVNQGCKMY